jgi:16S rRNA (guanine(1405)-N(7))-methyltransferase
LDTFVQRIRRLAPRGKERPAKVNPIAADSLDAFVEDIRRSKKYRYLCPATIRDILAQEFERQPSARESMRIARRRLHRLWAQFLGEPDYDACTQTLDAAFASADDAQVAAACLAPLRVHASTRERLGELAGIYSTLFAHTGIPPRLADLACALNPLSFRWMGLPRSVHYQAYDINQRVVDLVNHVFRLEGLAPLAELRDVLCCPPEAPADVALLLKMYHCLEHRQRGAGWHVVQAVPARWVAVSFPTHNLSARAVDIIGNYEADIRDQAGRHGYSCSRLDFASEAILVINKA